MPHTHTLINAQLCMPNPTWQTPMHTQCNIKQPGGTASGTGVAGDVAIDGVVGDLRGVDGGSEPAFCAKSGFCDTISLYKFWTLPVLCSSMLAWIHCPPADSHADKATTSAGNTQRAKTQHEHELQRSRRQYVPIYNQKTAAIITTTQPPTHTHTCFLLRRLKRTRIM